MPIFRYFTAFQLYIMSQIKEKLEIKVYYFSYVYIHICIYLSIYLYKYNSIWSQIIKVASTVTS